MCQHRIILLQNACLTRIVCHRMEGQYNRRSRYCVWFHRNLDDNRFCWLLLRLLINDVEGQFRNQERFVVFALVGSTMCAFIFLCPRVTNAQTQLTFQTEVAVESPRTSIESTQTDEVTLYAMVANRLVKTKGEGHVSHVVVAVEDVCTPIRTVESAVCPVTKFGCNKEMLPLACGLVVSRPRTITRIETHRPMWRNTYVSSEIERSRNVINKVVTHSKILLRVCLAAHKKCPYH